MTIFYNTYLHSVHSFMWVNELKVSTKIIFRIALTYTAKLYHNKCNLLNHISTTSLALVAANYLNTISNFKNWERHVYYVNSLSIE